MLALTHQDSEELCPENHSHVLKTGGKWDDITFPNRSELNSMLPGLPKYSSSFGGSDTIKADSKEEKSANKRSPIINRKKMITLVLWGLCGAPAQHDTVAVSAISSLQTAVKLVIRSG